MKRILMYLMLAVCAGLFTGTVLLRAEKLKVELVNIKKAAPGITVSLAYATRNNFAGRKFYPVNNCYLTKKAAASLVAAQEDFVKSGYSLKMLDCYRPRRVTLAMWDFGEEHNRKCLALGRACRRSGCDPKRADCLWQPLSAYMSKRSRHCRAASVDVTLTRKGKPVDMGTAYDHFGPEARTKNAKGAALKNRMLLKSIMARHGCRNYYLEWWHYDHSSYKDYPLMDAPLEEIGNTEKKTRRNKSAARRR